MKFSIQVKPNARKNEVVIKEDGGLVVHVSVPPIEGRANEKVIEVLAKHFGKSKRDISIIRGSKGKHKIIEVL